MTVRSTPDLAWPAPAKLNLFLHITGRRADGYHCLQTLFQLLNYGDRLWFEDRSDGYIHRCNALPGVSLAQDLTVRAATLLQQQTGMTRGVDITLDKRLPMGGGLGGGSSNAATTLVALNHLWRCGLSGRELERLALTLGADVPVFVRGVTAWAQGIGEALTPVTLPEDWYLVIDPGVSVSTTEIFAAPELTRNCPPITIEDFLAGHAGNVCEPVVARRYCTVREALHWLASYGTARMTGTGGCVFARFKTQAQAEQPLAELPQSWRGFVAQGVNGSPLQSRIAS